MKVSKLFPALLIITAFTLFGCQSKNPKELIVNKWTMTDLSGNGATQVPDSVKKSLYGKATIEFTKEGQFIGSDMGGGPQAGTYMVSDDGKTLITTDKGSTKPDSLVITELSSGKLGLSIRKEEINMSFKTK